MDEQGPAEGKSNLHQGHRQRLRRRFLREGLEGFEDHQVLELLLFYPLPRRDTNRLAHLLLKRFGSLSAVLEADPADLASMPEMGETAAVFLSLVPPLTRRYMLDRASRDKPRFNAPDKVHDYLVPLMAGRTEEVFYLLCLDHQNCLLFPALISSGTVNQSFVHPRDVVEAALRHKAAAVILAHNHPSGGLKPSKADIQLTIQLIKALHAIDIKVLDHIIVAEEESFRFSEAGLMKV